MNPVLISSYFILLVPWFNLGTCCPTLIMSQSDPPTLKTGCEDGSLIRLARYASTTESPENSKASKNEGESTEANTTLQPVASTAAPLKKEERK
ncbi:hypothetical protein J437_LFUL012804 [Ladona fulva]|uniref:Secreted protein n=1 Tax=Ladona fulva TaxID=123851 RepID=A0A8K0KQL5_LADFU|nr:hypothetical protein J437_LFUL012804 [Ladona fulva]